MYLSQISFAAMGSLYYIVAAKEKNGLRWHHRLITFSCIPFHNPWTVHCYVAIDGRNISSKNRIMLSIESAYDLINPKLRKYRRPISLSRYTAS